MWLKIWILVFLVIGPEICQAEVQKYRQRCYTSYKLQKRLDKILSTVRTTLTSCNSKFHDTMSCSFDDNRKEPSVSQFHNFKRSGTIDCLCYQDFVRFQIPIHFKDINFTLYLEALNELLCPLGLAGQLMSSVFSTLLDISLNLDADVLLSVDQSFEVGNSAVFSNVQTNRIFNVRFLKLNLPSWIENKVISLLTPSATSVIRRVMTDRIKGAISFVILKDINENPICSDEITDYYIS